MTTHLHAPVHSPARPSEALEGVPHRFLIALEGYYQHDHPFMGERWGWRCYDQQYEEGRRACMGRENFSSVTDALKAAEYYCGEGNGLVRYTYKVQGQLRLARLRAGLPA